MARRGFATDARQSLFYLVAETTAGTYEAPDKGVTRAVRLISQPSWEVGGTPKVTREDAVQALPGGAPPVLGARFRSVSFECHLTEWGDVESATDHELAGFFAACPVTITASASGVTMVPKTHVTAGVSVTWAEENGDVHSIEGGRGTFTLVAGDDMLWKLQGTVSGIYRGVVAESAYTDADGDPLDFTLPNYTSEPILRADEIDLTESIGGTSEIEGLRSVEFNPAHFVSERLDMTASTTGYTLPFATHQGQAQLALTFDALDEANLAVFADAQSNNGNLFTVTAETAGADKLIISLADAYLDFPSIGETNGMRTYDCVLRGVPSSGYDAYTITFK